MPFGAYGKAALLGPCGGVPTTFPSTWYLALLSANPGNAISLASELTIGVGGYARIAAPNNVATWDGPQIGDFLNSQEITNAIDLAWPVSSAAQGTARYVVGCDAPTGGNGWWYYAVPGGAFVIDRPGVALIVPAGTLVLDLSDPEA